MAGKKQSRNHELVAILLDDPRAVALTDSEAALLRVIAAGCDDRGAFRYRRADTARLVALLAADQTVGRSLSPATIERLRASLHRRGLLSHIPGRGRRPAAYVVALSWDCPLPAEVPTDPAALVELPARAVALATAREAAEAEAERIRAEALADAERIRAEAEAERIRAAAEADAARIAAAAPAPDATPAAGRVLSLVPPVVPQESGRPCGRHAHLRRKGRNCRACGTTVRQEQARERAAQKAAARVAQAAESAARADKSQAADPAENAEWQALRAKWARGAS